MYTNIGSTFRVEIGMNRTIILIPNQVLNNENFYIFLQISWVIILITLASNIPFLIVDLPEQLFLIDKLKRNITVKTNSVKKRSLKN